MPSEIDELVDLFGKFKRRALFEQGHPGGCDGERKVR